MEHKRSDYITGTIGLISVVISFLIAVLNRRSISLLSFLILTLFLPLLVIIIVAFIVGFKNPNRLSFLVKFDIVFVLAIMIVSLIVTPLFKSDTFVGRMTIEAHNLGIPLKLNKVTVSNFMTSILVFILAAFIFSFLGSKIKTIVNNNSGIDTVER